MSGRDDIRGLMEADMGSPDAPYSSSDYSAVKGELSVCDACALGCCRTGSMH
jgi:hypothetical protein